MCVNLKIDVSTITAKLNDNQDIIIREYQKLLFQDDPPSGGTNFKGISFIHLWGANCGNFNKNKGEAIDGGGQADAFKSIDEQGNKLGQKFGIFGLITTIHRYNQNKIHVKDKIHDKSSFPSSSPAPGGATAATAAADLSRASSSASSASST